MKLTAALFVSFSTIAFAQTPQVPHKMEFAGTTLTIRDDARREIQKDVDMLTQSPKHLNIKVERAKTYFPIIERVLAEERVPDDFKYLVLQESALIPDAVSVSNAVGFWQFKDFTAMEMGLRVDKEIDERMNIEASTRGAAKYIKKNNYYFNNWLYALQAYQMGAGGVMKVVSDYESGAKRMEITSKTYWYVKKFLAHKIAFEGVVKGVGEIKVMTVMNRSKKSMRELATEFAVDEEELKSYNKWARKDFVPDDKPYAITIPIAGNIKAINVAIAKAEKAKDQPLRVDAKPADARNEILLVNGISAIKANPGETIGALVKRGDLNLSYFLKCNDLSISDKLVAGDFYYLKNKRSKSTISKHVMREGESLWSISQRYGVQLRKLRKYNHNSTPQVGSIALLSNKRTPLAETEFSKVAEVDSDDTFNWSVEPEGVQASIQNIQVVAAEIEKVLVQEEQDTTEQEIVVPPSKHIVSAGETLYSISKRYQVEVMEIVRWNHLKLETGINPGQLLMLRPSPESPSPTTDIKDISLLIIHQVKNSDTLYSVARQYGVTIKELMDWNLKKDFNLTVGENLKILKKEK